MTNASNQSGDARSADYDNLNKGPAEDESFPLVCSWGLDEKHRALTNNLKPKE